MEARSRTAICLFCGERSRWQTKGMAALRILQCPRCNTVGQLRRLKPVPPHPWGHCRVCGCRLDQREKDNLFLHRCCLPCAMSQGLVRGPFSLTG